MIVTIDLDQIKEWVAGADKIVLTPDAEASIMKLLEMSQTVEKAIDEAKAKIQEAALALNPDFKSVHSDNLSVAYRAYGSRFSVDETYLNTVPKELYKTKVTVSPIPEEVVKYADAHEGKLPMGIIEKERTKQLIITAKKGIL